MKAKFLVPIGFSVLIGFLLGQIFFNQYDNNSISVFNEGETLYFIDFGKFDNMSILKDKVKNYNDFLVVLESDGYHVYAGISKKKDVANRIKGYYRKIGNNVYIKEKKVANRTFLNILGEYDKITSIASNDKDLLSIEKIVISNYEEMVVSNDVEN